jgi:putative sugar O-methyltransferase
MDAALAQLLDELKTVPEVYRPSPFWQELAAANVKQLEDSGFENFKRTVNTRYFNWRVLGILRHQLMAIARNWVRHPSGTVFRAEFPQPRASVNDRAASFDGLSAWIYKTYVAMYANILHRQDRRRLLETLEEPELGNPFLVEYEGRRVSQDLCNSVHELYSILGPDGLAASASPSFAELGAGYGRLGYVILKAIPDASYTIIDIPPALYVSQRYLTELFPMLPAFRFRPFSLYADIKAEFESATIRFLAPHQAELLPPKSFNYFINVSSLHEMTLDQVKNYFRLINTLCRGRFYTKQWRVSRTQVNGCTLREHDYPVSPEWRTLFHRKHPIQRMFFDALYDIP